jgi:hypothetical protein
MSPEIQDLNMRVSEAIFFAARAAPGSREAQETYGQVSMLEERIARLTDATDVEGAVARVGAVSAALRAGDWLRASRLLEEFLAGAPDDVATELRTLAREVEEAACAVPEPNVRPVHFALAAA